MSSRSPSLVARGFSNKDIAEELVISQRTAEGHVAKIMDRLGVTPARRSPAGWPSNGRESREPLASRAAPVELTTFVGRRQELVEGRRMVRAAPLVTLVGPGGVGKTRLAARLAHQLSRVFRDRVGWVELASAA